MVVQKLELLPLDVRCCNNKEAPLHFKCHCGQNQVRCASINKGKKKDTRCKIDWGSEDGK